MHGGHTPSTVSLARFCVRPHVSLRRDRSRSFAHCLGGRRFASAVKGYDPVAYFEPGEPTPGHAGSSMFSDEHRYRFFAPAPQLLRPTLSRYAPNRELLRDRASPAASSRRPIRVLADHEGRLFLFSMAAGPDQTSRSRFQRPSQGQPKSTRKIAEALDRLLGLDPMLVPLRRSIPPCACRRAGGEVGRLPGTWFPNALGSNVGSVRRAVCAACIASSRRPSWPRAAAKTTPAKGAPGVMLRLSFACSIAASYRRVK